jgi:hypothetical protein
MDDEKVIIPRHVDSRRLVLGVEVYTFLLKVLPLLLLCGGVGVGLYKMTSSKGVIVIIGIIIGLIIMAFTEFKNRRTGLDIFKASRKYKKRGNATYHRANHSKTDFMDRFTCVDIVEGSNEDE